MANSISSGISFVGGLLWGDVRSPQATAAAIATRLPSNPIIRPKMLPGRDGANINGPSLIATPEWLPGRLGKYYLYFAHHEGTYIRLAYADEEPTGPWTVHRAGTLRLAQVPMCHSHIASPADVHVDDRSQEIRMYFHGAVPGSAQRSFVATSPNGLDFTVSRRGLAAAYLRAVHWDDQWIGMDKTASLRWSPDGLTKFVNSRVNNLGVPAAALRHVALELAGAAGPRPSVLNVYYTKVGDAPESIWRCKIDLDHGWRKRQARDHTLVLAPERRWEGALRRTRPSKRGLGAHSRSARSATRPSSRRAAAGISSTRLPARAVSRSRRLDR